MSTDLTLKHLVKEADNIGSRQPKAGKDTGKGSFAAKLKSSHICSGKNFFSAAMQSIADRLARQSSKDDTMKQGVGVPISRLITQSEAAAIQFAQAKTGKYTAIDGPGASGKSTTAKLLAKKLGFGYIDSGAMFRAVTLKCQQQHVDVHDQEQVARIAKSVKIAFPLLGQVELDGHDVSELIRTSNITRNISPVASNVQVREILADQQRAMAKGDIPGACSTGFEREGKHIQGIVMDGRDIGTVILPDAELKVFIVADVRVRAQRRFDELKQRQGEGLKETLEQVEKDLEARDLADRTRKVAPLSQAKDAIVLDTSHLTIEEQVNKIEQMVYKRL
ncbi:hypothetical protein CU098_012235 [Rhizopus stolonifer]|uniref:(d)CMP kinase n=1 Tax=Rhizopus stolonifer TaxID=4846 RepID=A0A367KS56_RHIST|nr:hypothetical protein CU098_012235 [Rhizopus stolonifer]